MAGEILTVAASPNAFSRNAIDVQVSHTDVGTWNPPGGGGKTVEYSTDGGATWLQAGVWTPTTNVCGTQSADFTNVGGITSSTLSDFTIYAPDDIPHDTLVRVRVRANTVDGDFRESGEMRTRDYPTFACAPADVTANSATLGLGDDSPTGQTNVASCGADTIIWEYGTTPGGPYTTVLPSEPVTGFSPSKAVTGLSPGTTYYYRARLSEVTDTHAEYLVTQECPFTTTAAAGFTPECDGSAPTTSTSGTAAGAADGVPADHTLVLALGTAPGGPYTTLSPATAGTGTADQTVTHTFTGLTASTTYYFRTEVRDAGNAVVDSSVECSFTTQAGPEPPGPRPFEPQPCDTGGAGADAVDVEQTILCDTLPDGTIAGTAMAVWEYDTEGNPTGPPTFVDPATGNPYVAQGTLMPCPGETGCLEPVAFHRTTTSTGPVDHPGRQYDLVLPINPGFAVQSLQVDQVTNPANIVWDVADPDGEQFRQDLTVFIEGRVPAAATVTITNPNAGVPQVCGAAQPMQIHIECVRLDQNPPDLIELIYNGGQDLIQNPAYNEFPALDPPVSQGDYGFRLLSREDDPGPFPGSPPSGEALCTTTANRGWETNDVGRTFEIWGRNVADGQDTTPTPRGTPVQEMTSDGPPPGGRSTIWQTFVAPSSGNFIIRVVHGARDPGEQHRITLDNGDTDDVQNGDLIDDVSNPPSVTSSGGPNPWTQFTQTIPLNGGSTYTLALSTNNPAGGARGGLFTDMRAYIDRPDQRATAATDDETCVVTVEETTTACDDELWSPICENGSIESWQNAATGEILSNSAFWGQAPAPVPGPCPASASGGEGGSVAANLVHTYPVCATIGGVRTNLQRVVITDPSGGVLADSFIGPDGGPVPTPAEYDIGSCPGRCLNCETLLLCDESAGTPATITGAGVSSGALSNGLTWTAENPGGLSYASGPSNSDGAWWGLQSFPISTSSPVVWEVSRPSVIEFSVYVRYHSADPTISRAQLPAGLDVVRLPHGYSYDAATGVLTRLSDDPPTDPCSYVTDPQIATTARFRTREPVTSVTVGPAPNSRVAVCGRFFTYWAGAVTVTPVGQFLRRICRDCDGTVTGFTDTEFDGTTPYVPLGEVGACQDPEPCCQPVQVCVTPQVIEETQFVSNPDQVYDDEIDGTWEWAPVGAFTDPTQVVTWYQTYKARYAPNPAAWSVTDAPTRASGAVNSPQAGWIAPHPGGLTGSSGAPGEGPTLNAENWWARASFNLPAAADPDSIKVEITVLNADQRAVRFRLNSGAWTAMPATATHNGTRYTLPATALPGVQAGVNTLYFEVQETLANGPTNGAGVMAHFIVTYEIPGHSSWTRMVCCDDTVYYIDNEGTRHDSLPTGYSIEPCGTAAEPLVLCDDNGPFLRHVTYADGTVIVRDTTLIGEDYSTVGAVEACGGGGSAVDRVDAESVILCDSAAVPNRFIRTFSYTAAGAVAGFTDTTLAGAPFAPTGAVGVCAQVTTTDLDFVVVELCDNNGAFLRRFTFNSTTGAVTATTNTTLAGAAYNPVGAVGICDGCCPQVIADDLCTNTGSGRATAVRATNGTVTLIDSVSGAAVTAANIVPCTDDDTVRTLTAQARILTDSTPWTPGADVTGTLTSLTVTGTSGLWDLVDASGTVLTGLPAGLTLTWNAEDDNQLTGPQSVTPQAGATVVANWTQR